MAGFRRAGINRRRDKQFLTDAALACIIVACGPATRILKALRFFAFFASNRLYRKRKLACGQ